jgi:hypothetical protein
MTRHTLPKSANEQLRQRYAISDTLTANFLAALWASKGESTRANLLREIRDRKLADVNQIPRPKTRNLQCNCVM